MKASAIIVTRGDVDLEPILKQDWPEQMREVVIWDNSQEQADLAVYGRYAAISRTSHPVIYVQDDDCVLPRESLRTIVDSYEPGRLVANMPRSRWEDYPDSSLVGWGAIFDSHLPREAFGRLPFPIVDPRMHEWFNITCDVAFTAMTPRTIIDVPFSHLPWAEGPDRMFTGRATHDEERQRMLDLARRSRGDDDDRRNWRNRRAISSWPSVALKGADVAAKRAFRTRRGRLRG